MIIGVDLQPFQTASKNRGIGRYSKNLLDNILKIDTEDKFKLFLNNTFKENVQVAQNKNTEFEKINYMTSTRPEDIVANNLVQFLKYRYSNLDALFIMSTFEGHPINPATMSTFFDRLNSLLCVVVYDFIPLHFADYYLKNPTIREVIYRQLKILYQADILFTISESTRKDAITLLGLNPDRVINIYGGISDAFYYIKELPTKKIESIKRKYNIPEKFILYVGGIDFRKNIEKSIIAFSKMEKSLLHDLSYVLVCEITEFDRKQVGSIGKKYGVEDKLILTGYIPDEDLNVLYNCCDVFVFPSLMEGLGIPVLEAMKCGAPVIGGNNSSISEIIKDERFMFNSENEGEIADLLDKILKNDDLREKSIQNSLTRHQIFTWENSAKKVLSTLRSSNEKIQLKKSKHIFKKLKIAYFSPLPPKMSGLSYYSAKLLPFLSKYWDIDIFTADGYVCDDQFLQYNFNIYSYLEFEQLNKIKNYDSTIYQMGNSDHHTYMFDMIKKYPGVVVLHDVFLSNLIYWMTIRLGKFDKFAEEVIYSHGEQGKKLVNKAKKNLIPWDKLVLDLPMHKRVLDNATGIIVHSKWDQQKILEFNPQFENKITIANQFAPIRMTTNKTQIKKNLGFSTDDFLVCSFGFVASTKKIDSIVRNIKNFLNKTPCAKYVLVGDAGGVYGEQVKKIVNDLKLTNQILFTEFVDDLEYKKYVDICDVCISLRTNTRAGTSASVNHALGSGLPTIISDEGPFTVFPDDTVIKIKDKQEKDLSEILLELYENESKRQILGKNAQKFAQQNHSIEMCTDKYVETMKNVLQKQN